MADLFESLIFILENTFIQFSNAIGGSQSCLLGEVRRTNGYSAINSFQINGPQNLLCN